MRLRPLSPVDVFIDVETGCPPLQRRVLCTIRAISSQCSEFDPYSFTNSMSEMRLLGGFSELSICSSRIGMHKLADRFGGGISYALLDFRSLQ